MTTVFSGSYFIDGGTLRANTPSYVKRPADNELFDALMNCEFCYILTPRQMGKSSLMIQTSQRLREQNIKTASVDIQGIGTTKVREWYASLLSQIRRGLKLSVDIDEWMQQKRNIGFGQLFMDFIQDVVLTEIPEQVVIFLDEVDWMIKIDFRDDFFASIRSVYNARAQYPEFNRVSFVLLGVASPADLISEPTRTPFNIGHAIPLRELSLKDATPLEEGLEKVFPGEGSRILKRIFYWTSGHPYLTQKLCKTIAETDKSHWSDSEVDNLVDKLFLSDESRKEANLKFIQDRILNNEQYVELLKLYKRARKSKIKENGQSLIQNQLMLSGLLTSRNGSLEIHNRIYRTVFNDRWINQNTPKNWQRIAVFSFGIIIILFISIFLYDFTVGMQLKNFTVDFYSSISPEQRLKNLANIYRLKGVLSNTDSGLSASQLFYGLQREDQLAIFSNNFIAGDANLQDDLVVVISHLYITVADVDPENNNTELLQTMRISLNKINTNSEVEALKQEVSSWLSGRQNYLNGNYQQALQAYGSAISSNPQNPATVYERALVYVALEDYQNALKDLDTTIGLAKESTQQDVIDLTPTVTFTSVVLPTETLTLVPSTITKEPVSTEAPTTTVSNTVVPRETQNPLIIPSANPNVPINTPLIPTVTITPMTSNTERFESNFSTFIEIVNAVKTLIDKTQGLRNAIQSNNSVSYVNLESVGFMKLISSRGTSEPTEPAILQIGWAGSPDTLNPGAAVLSEAYTIFNLVYDTMYRLQLDGSFKLSLADSVNISEDSLIYTYKIHDGVTFHDGQPLTAEDVVFSYYLYKNTDGYPWMSDYAIYFENIESTPNNEVVITLSEAIPNLEAQLVYLYILPKHIWEDQDPVEFENLTMTGSGPFMMADYKQNESVRLSKNADYFGSVPKIDEVLFQTFESQDALIDAIKTGQVDMITEMPSTAVASLQDDPNVEVVIGAPYLPSVFDIIFNQISPENCPSTDGICSGHPALLDRDVRLALAHATDKQKIIDTVLLGFGTPGIALLPDGLGHWYNSSISDYVYNTAVANQILDDAGYTDSDGDGIREMPDGTTSLIFRINWPSDSVDSPRVAELLSEMWGQIGVKLEALALDPEALMSTCCPAFDFDIILWGWGTDPDPNFLLSVMTTDEISTGTNETGYSNAVYDALYYRQATELDLNTRRELVWQMQQIAFDDIVYIIPYYEQKVQAYRSDRFTGWALDNTTIELTDITSLEIVEPVK